MDAIHAAAYLCIKTKNPYETIRRYVKDGRLKASRVGGRMTFTPENLDAFVELMSR